jgi:alkaline phosphatase D
VSTPDSRKASPPLAAFPEGLLDSASELGAVTDRSVRVWFRAPSGAVTVRLTTVGYPQVEMTARTGDDTDWTGVVELALPGPAAEQPFHCEVNGAILNGRFAPLRGASASLTFGFGSCHRPFSESSNGKISLTGAAGIYPEMAKELKASDAALLLLAGDQVYSDELRPISVREAVSTSHGEVPTFEEALAAYRYVSRGYLGQSGYRFLRQQLPTICIWDDHDIFTNWGSRLGKSALDRRLFEAATRAYYEYQHQRNPSGESTAPPFHYTMEWGDIGFLVLDVRGARDYERGRLLGVEQWQFVQAYLAGAVDIQTLFVVSSLPIAHVSRWMTYAFDRLPGHSGDQVRDRWSAAAFADERDALLDALFTWQRGGPTRQIFVLSGDVHAASAFTIRERSREGVLHQLTSSALTTSHTTLQRLLNSIAVRAPNLFERRFRFERHFLTFANNFGLVRVEPFERGGHRVSLSVRAWHPGKRTLSTSGTLVAEPGQ